MTELIPISKNSSGVLARLGTVYLRRLYRWMGSPRRTSILSDEFNGCYAACPIDFRHYVTVNIYEDKNAYWIDGDFSPDARPEHRDYLNYVSTLMIDYNHMELAWEPIAVPATSTTSGKPSMVR